MIGVGLFELLVGLLVAVLLLYYYVLRGRRSVALVLLAVVLTPVLGFFVAVGVAFLRYALLGR